MGKYQLMFYMNQIHNFPLVGVRAFKTREQEKRKFCE